MLEMTTVDYEGREHMIVGVYSIYLENEKYKHDEKAEILRRKFFSEFFVLHFPP